MSRPVQEDSSGRSRPQSNLPLSQAVAAYLSGLPQEQRQASAQDLYAFARWFGSQRAVGSITPPDLERYQEQLAAEARTDLSNRLESLRGFLAAARERGWTATNLAGQIKLKRKKITASSSGAACQEHPEGETLRLTREGYEKLSRELQHLETRVRPQIAEELRRAAADKDFRENAPYDVAKQHQGEVEARIRELRRILENGQVVQVEESTVIDLGSRVTLRDLSEDEIIVYTLVGPGEIDPKQGKISIQSPVGKALSGKTIGSEVEVQVPAGTLRLRVEKVENRR